ncbi:hypothetical protein VFPPC_15575 [Pochonia chlamydosporia 170]|uniref:Uncharacterized protein n=1 Tax=Pochonia chlamydosporia 170 TaxID=1380566 RepID=A0A179FZN2_METCM|nr:hypothetical protein VFPPC_15575 [Pochonia chlamydosporia 170]OAQ70429.2 hypothetical protein VFPPC_15575 [Pochonia chlamydosporia 170]
MLTLADANCGVSSRTATKELKIKKTCKEAKKSKSNTRTRNAQSILRSAVSITLDAYQTSGLAIQVFYETHECISVVAPFWPKMVFAAFVAWEKKSRPQETIAHTFFTSSVHTLALPLMRCVFASAFSRPTSRYALLDRRHLSEKTIAT